MISIRELKRKYYSFTDTIRWAYQRLIRGWDDRVCWGVDYYLAKNLPEWIAIIKKRKRGVAAHYFTNEELNKEMTDSESARRIIDKRQKEYFEILDKISLGFSQYRRICDLDFHYKSNEYLRACEQYEEAKKLFFENIDYIGY